MDPGWQNIITRENIYMNFVSELRTLAPEAGISGMV